jgi:hypothetical protein
MQIPRPAQKSVPSLTERWEVPAHAIIDWAAEGLFALTTRLPAVRCGSDTVSGIVGVDPSDVHPLFRRTEPAETAVVRRVSEERRQWRAITWPCEGVTLRRGDVMVPIRHVERFELVHGLMNGTIEDLMEHVRQQAGADEQGHRGAPEHYDWDAMFGAAARRVHDLGIPARKKELVRDMLDWFAGRDPDAVPDERTIERKLRPFWQALQGA